MASFSCDEALQSPDCFIQALPFSLKFGNHLI
jgi:hypothetical protein